MSYDPLQLYNSTLEIVRAERLLQNARLASEQATPDPQPAEDKKAAQQQKVDVPQPQLGQLAQQTPKGGWLGGAPASEGGVGASGGFLDTALSGPAGVRLTEAARARCVCSSKVMFMYKYYSTYK